MLYVDRQSSQHYEVVSLIRTHFTVGKNRFRIVNSLAQSHTALCGRTSIWTQITFPPKAKLVSTIYCLTSNITKWWNCSYHLCEKVLIQDMIKSYNYRILEWVSWEYQTCLPPSGRILIQYVDMCMQQVLNNCWTGESISWQLTSFCMKSYRRWAVHCLPRQPPPL